MAAIAACRSSTSPSTPPSTPPPAEAEREALSRVGYLDGYTPASHAVGVTVHDPRAWPGTALIVSAHEEAATLVDLDGRVLHSWSRPFSDLFPGQQPLVPEERGRRWLDWRRARMLPDGSLLALHENFGAFALGWDGAVRWAIPDRAHHDLDPEPDGRFWVLERRLTAHPELRPEPVLEDFVVERGPDGGELRRISVLDALRRGDRQDLLDAMPSGPDVLHTNSVRLLDGTGSERTPWLAAGGLLLSLREVDAVVAIDPASGAVVGGLVGPWDAQHDATITPEGRLLVFDNRGNGGFARGLEVEPSTGAVAWAWPERPDPAWRSPLCGTAQRLPNGHTQLVFSTIGRAVEVTPAGEIVWAYENPGRSRSDPRLVATLLQVDRLPSVALPPGR